MQKPAALCVRQQSFGSGRKRYCSFQLRLMQMAERRSNWSLRRQPLVVSMRKSASQYQYRYCWPQI